MNEIKLVGYEDRIYDEYESLRLELGTNEYIGAIKKGMVKELTVKIIDSKTIEWEE